MMRVALEEWRGGGVFSAKLLAWFALGTVLALLITQFQPGSVFLVMSFGGLAGGFLSGGQHWNHTAGEWLAQVGVLGYTAGKLAGLLLLNAAWALFLAPPLLLTGLSWGMPWSAAASALAWVLLGSAAAQALTHAAVKTASVGGRVVAGFLLGLWLLGALFSDARVLHPLWQIWRLFHDPELPFDTAAWWSLLGLTAAAWALAALRLGARREA